jgi:hypothetical protein
MYKQQSIRMVGFSFLNELVSTDEVTGHRMRKGNYVR